jgi:hypothetical protein
LKQVPVERAAGRVADVTDTHVTEAAGRVAHRAGRGTADGVTRSAEDRVETGVRGARYRAGRGAGRVGGGRVGNGRVGADGVVALVESAVLDGVGVGVRVEALVDDHALVTERLGAGVDGQDVGAHRGVDRRGDVGVRGDGEVDRRGGVDGQIHVGVEVEDRDDLLVGQRGGPFATELLGGQALLVVAHRSSIWCARAQSGCLPVLPEGDPRKPPLQVGSDPWVTDQ